MANPVPAREYEPGYDSNREFQDWMNDLHRQSREKATEMSETTVTETTDVKTDPKTGTTKTVTKVTSRRGARKPTVKPVSEALAVGKAQTPKVTPDAAKAKDASVLNGVSNPATPKPAKKVPARKTETVKLPKAADLGQANDSQATVTANGNSKRTANQELAKRLADAAAREFAKDDTASQEKVANWLKSLPTGGEGAGPLRYWPEGFARPTSADWKR